MTVSEYNHDFLPLIERANEFIELFESSIDHMDDKRVDKEDVRKHFRIRGWSKETKQTILAALDCYKEHEGVNKITHKVSEDSTNNEFEKGYQQALKEISYPMAVITEEWNPSVCPRCNESFYDFEPCFDGYYNRASNLDRCPFCGQRLDWDKRKR